MGANGGATSIVTSNFLHLNATLAGRNDDKEWLCKAVTAKRETKKIKKFGFVV
ncbi:hypothetical protein CBOM_07249 [Ceraceosorus bombacis]|uniref:Uncharacterized protein n=1 Tax=Ceraceosorus bombacis TaxID=401625 RepID=A0A0P1B998_9BASI|nr:hypothetical protein CBOM_07249 [Ceraceosorus bombacis]